MAPSTCIDAFAGAAIPTLQAGEEMKFFEDTRPSSSTTEFIDYLIACMISGSGRLCIPL